MAWGFPGSQVPFVTEEERTLTSPWLFFLKAIFDGTAARGQAATVLVPAGSPVSYTTGQNGIDAGAGGTVSAISIQRGTAVIPTGVLAGMIPAQQGDILKITYTVKPTINFIPGGL